MWIVETLDPLNMTGITTAPRFLASWYYLVVLAYNLLNIISDNLVLSTSTEGRWTASATSLYFAQSAT